jgi:exopolysaccharide biosynthesis protein
VAGIESGSAAIPPDGYVIWYGLNNTENRSQFSPGTTVDYEITYNENDQIDFKSSIGNYPLLLAGGRVAVGNVNEEKLTIEAPRSFAGVTGDNVFVMGTVDSANVWGLAEVAKNLGLSDALNLDGGASSGLYYSGGYISEPGRLLSNCLAVIIN